MNDLTYDLLTGFIVMIYNLVVLAGVSFLVVHYEWSGWWYLPAFFILYTTQPFIDTNTDLKEKNEKI